MPKLRAYEDDIIATFTTLMGIRESLITLERDTTLAPSTVTMRTVAMARENLETGIKSLQDACPAVRQLVKAQGRWER